jgi:hypothetical protein
LFSTFLKIVLLVLLFGYWLNSSHPNALATGSQVRNELILSIDTFSAFPPEIDGCSCYFSNDSTEFKQRKYIYMNDNGQTSFLKINGALTKFTQTSFKEIDKTTTLFTSKSDKYDMTIKIISGAKSGDESSLMSGTIKLMDQTGKTITKTFFGECGC